MFGNLMRQLSALGINLYDVVNAGVQIAKNVVLTGTFTQTGNAAITGNATVTGNLTLTGELVSDKVVRVAKVALAALDTAGGVLAWANPTGASIIVSKIILDVTTKSTGACTLDVGVAANGTTSNDTLLDGVDVGTAAGLFDNVTNKGIYGLPQVKVTSAQYITASKATGAAAGLVGNAYIHYVLA